MSSVATITSVFTNREFPFQSVSLSDTLEKRNRKYYVDYNINNQPIFFQINKVVLSSEPIFIDDEQGYIDVEIRDRLPEIKKYFQELDNFNQVSCFERCEEWLGKKLGIEEIEGVYKTSFRDNKLRLKIEKENIRIFDFKKNKLDLDRDIKVGNVLDIIIEISGLKVMKNAFATHLVLRQIRQHPAPVPLRTKVIPKEYLFIDDYSKRNMIKEEASIDSQTDVDVLVHRRKKTAPPALLEEKSEKSEKSEESEKSEDTKESEDVDLHLDEIMEESEKPKKPVFDIEKADENTNEYLQSVEKLKHMMNTIMDEPSSTSKVSKKDQILKQLEQGDLTLGSLISEKTEKTEKSEKLVKKGSINRKKPNVPKPLSQELYKNL